MNNIIIFAAIGFLVLLFVAIGFFLYLIYMATSGRGRHYTITVADNVEVSADWSEIKSDYPLKPSKQIHDIDLVVDGLSYHLKTKQNLLPSGEAVNPEVELVDTDGNVHRLRSGGGGVGDYNTATDTFGSATMSFRLVTDDLPSSAKFQTIRIRSDIPFRCSKINWHNWRMK